MGSVRKTVSELLSESLEQEYEGDKMVDFDRVYTWAVFAVLNENLSFSPSRQSEI